MKCTKEENSKNCKCTYEACGRRGICCQCVAYHINKRQIPGCFFTEESERTYDRSFEHFARLVQEGKR